MLGSRGSLLTLRRLATRGILPSCIAKILKLPLCAACTFAKAHRRNWRHKGKQSRSIRKSTDTKPGCGTSCDHILSSQPGLLPQSMGTMTHERFWGSTLFVDHYSDFIYNHLINGTSSLETLASKIAYERVANTYGVKIKAYHADNLRFNDNFFSDHCNSAGQKLTFYGVGAHHQNAVAESNVGSAG